MQALYVNALIQENTELQFCGRHKVSFVVQCCGFATPLAHGLVTFSDALSYSRKDPSHYGGGITDSGGCGFADRQRRARGRCEAHRGRLVSKGREGKPSTSMQNDSGLAQGPAN